jgi:hypothetical protein
VRRREYQGESADVAQALQQTVAGLKPELERLGTRLEEAAALLARTDRPVIEKPFELAELARDRAVGG